MIHYGLLPINYHDSPIKINDSITTPTKHAKYAKRESATKRVWGRGSVGVRRSGARERTPPLHQPRGKMKGSEGGAVFRKNRAIRRIRFIRFYRFYRFCRFCRLKRAAGSPQGLGGHGHKKAQKGTKEARKRRRAEYRLPPHAKTGQRAGACSRPR